MNLNTDNDQTLLRAELFSADQMEQHGKALASRHVIGKYGAQNRLLKRLDENRQVLLGTRSLLTSAVKDKLPITPAGEWLLDNFYLIEEQIRIAKQHLPNAYSRELPRLAKGPSQNLPRVYDLALEAISHGDGRVDSESLLRFVASYQTVTPLTLGELWAFPIMLRLALIENLRRVGIRITDARIHVNQAQEWADQMMEMADSDPKNLILVIADMARSNPPMVSPFVAELARRLQGHGQALALPLTWIEQRLAESSLTIERMVLSETQQQAADQVSISNTIGSLRFLGAMDWKVFVETMSHVEQVLLRDIDGIYGKMDFATRDCYRHVIDKLAKCSDMSETEIAREAIQLAHWNAANHDEKKYLAHVGYYLIDEGVHELERAVHAELPLVELIGRWLGRSPLSIYLCSISLLTGIFSGCLLLLAYGHGVSGWPLVALGCLMALATSQLASALTNRFATLLVRPKPLPRMDYSRGITESMASLVVVPTLLTSVNGIEELLEALEVRFLGNQDTHLHFALLTDLRDAEHEILADDDLLLSTAQAGIETLNKKYRSSGDDRFFLLHRPRLWNTTDHVWMGRERKRGKLSDLNLLLRGQGRDRFSLVVGSVDALSKIKYVITLDTDTLLPRDSARQFVAAMAHPLNRPRFDEYRQRVCGGYSILQPRMAASLSGANRSRYAQLFGNEPGIDPYTRSVSDVYQDVFGEGSFIGKGIYDVDAFEHAIKGRFPDNRILSHDLLEGCYSRSGLISDVHLYEEYPARYQDDVGRQKRWIRGDWQIADWLFPVVPGPDRHKLRNPLSNLSRWKIFDNLRRSLATPALLLSFLIGWTLFPQPLLWTVGLLGTLVLPSLLGLLLDALRWPGDVRLSQHWSDIWRTLQQNFAQAGFKITCLPFEAVYIMDAVLRTTWRLLISHRKLLEWAVASPNKPKLASTADNTNSDQKANSFAASYRSMWIAPALAIGTLTIIVYFNASAFFIAFPVLLAWLVAPAIAWWISEPLARNETRLSEQQTRFLHRIARKTWEFFERFTGAEDNWLPPDNFQEQPGPIIAHRTSPTNIGMALLANLSAWDFAYIPTGILLERTVNTFGTMALLERHQGHFYNWYDTLTLKPLLPRYISSVDSGNLAGHLLTLRAGLLALPDQKIIAPLQFEGLRDTFAVLMEARQNREDSATARLQTLIDAACLHKPDTVLATWQAMNEILVDATTLALSVDHLDANSVRADESTWAIALEYQCRSMLEELNYLAPWLRLPNYPDALETNLESNRSFSAIPTLHDLANNTSGYSELAAGNPMKELTTAQQSWHAEFEQKLELGAARAKARINQIDALALQANELATMEYQFLYDPTRHLLAIGYNVDEFRRDVSFYDLLASEARLCSFVAIAQGQLPQESWFALSRLQTSSGGEPILASWSGSMFEYLMPLLVMPTYEGTLLDQTYHAAVSRQIAYGNQHGLPWGVSESGYNTVDANLNYQYHAFGVPGLGLKRGLAEDLVVAPYASALALMVDAEAACANLQRLSDSGMEAQYGFYEAIDYTPSRLPRNESSTNNESSVIVRSFMAHHQGMSLLALAYLLLDQPMQKRFESDLSFQATLLLLQERIPKNTIVQKPFVEDSDISAFTDNTEASVHVPMGADTAMPEVQLLSNGRYQVMVTNAGGGYSRWKDLAVTRWREDSTCDNWGSFIYLRDIGSGEFWSATHQPTLKRAQSYEAMFSEGRAEFRRRDNDIETYSEIVVSPEDDIEIRRVRITNRSKTRRTIELTSYAEVVLASPAADMTQPSFGNLFVQTEIIGERRAILCTRRPRSAEEHTPWMFHLLAVSGTDVFNLSYETNRMQFIGRGQTLAAPLALSDSINALSGSEGSVLDPIAAIRCRITLEPEQTATLDFVTGAADNRDACLSMVDKYQDRHLADRVFDLAWTHSGVTLRQINASEIDAQLYRRLAGSVIYANSSLRADPAVLIQNRRGQSGLWGYAISGDLPIVLLKIADTANIDLARQMIQCHAYWRLKGLVVDLVIWNEDHVGYRQQLQDQIMGMIATGSEALTIDRPGGIFVRSFEQISNEDRVLLQSVARVIVADRSGSLSDQFNRRALGEKRIMRLNPTRSHRHEPASMPDAPGEDLLLANNFGGFSADGSEYIINTAQKHLTPLPWVNVLANPDFGTVITESGLSYTWSENAHEFRLTPWSDDPVGASGGEAIYLRDEETGHFWSPTPQPCSGAMPYVTRHGFGYSVFEHTAGGIHSQLWIYVDLEDSVKFSMLKIRNGSGRTRRLSATGYVEWVLGDLRPKSAMHVVTEIDAASGALFARNAYNSEFPDRVAFFDVDDISRSVTGDRTEFLGRNGSLKNPEAMTRARLSGRLGAGLDPCGAIQVPFELADGQEKQIIFRMGAGRDLEQTRELAIRLRKPGSARASFEKVQQYWEQTLSAVQVKTPEPALDVLANGWLIYQTLACRIWARSGFYQSGGAFGFRDQLQDVMALVHAEPALAREHLLRCSEHQYPEGDVQHWWHPPAGRGVRTRCSDDYLWLPLATYRYVTSTGDSGVLDESRHFLSGRLLNSDEESYYDLPARSEETATLYEHCVRAIRHGLSFGTHGLPLMGSGDWNDGMNLVGIHGKGESVWLAFFMIEVLSSFAELATMRSDDVFAETCRMEVVKLRQNIEAHAWDGEWYRRAYFDDGSPLGSKLNTECTIDSISQSWSVLSGVNDPEHSRMAMNSLDKYLVRRNTGLIQLLDPPFDKSDLNPGYIKGYVPGVRENGGQYTHAAIWATMAFAKMGDSVKAWELLNLINPVNHALDADGVAIYKTEPYVMAADVYGQKPHTGRGGWTWYTGSASWMYRLMLESLLGLKREGNTLSFSPCIPENWTTYSMSYRFAGSTYKIAFIQNLHDDAEKSVETTISLDGIAQTGNKINLIDDYREHMIEVSIGRYRSLAESSPT
ncbi:MAG: glucoamylase family protein [Arenimonas sp.]